MASFVNPFDAETLFLHIFAGSPEIFTFIAIIVISGALAFFRVPDKIYLPMLALFGILFALWIGVGLYVLTILIVGLITFKAIAKIVT